MKKPTRRPRLSTALRILACSALLLASAGGCTSSHGPDRDGGARDGGARDGGARDGGARDGGGPDAGDVTSCMSHTQCVVVPASCCGSCGAATRGDAIAVHTDRASAYRTAACGEDTGCPACFMEQDPTLVGSCVAGRCAVVDLRAHPSAECTDATQCRIRTRDCCECGGDVSRAGLIAIRIDRAAAYEAVVCDPGTGCPECLPVYPEEALPGCSAGGYCEVVWAATTEP